jgi:hypothetical protein
MYYHYKLNIFYLTFIIHTIYISLYIKKLVRRALIVPKGS